MRGGWWLWALAGLACGPAIDDAGDGSSMGRVEVYPSVVGLGVSLDIQLTSEEARFVAGRTTLDLGPGLNITDLDVADANTLFASIEVDAATALGPRDVLVQAGSWSRELPDALTVISESLSISPNRAHPGQIVEVELTGVGTAWDTNAWPRFGEGTEVVALTDVASNFARAMVAIDSDAPLGRRDVSIGDLTLFDGFFIDRGAAVTADLDVTELPQGEWKDFVLHGEGTAWTADTRLSFWDEGGENADVQVTTQQLVDPQTITGVVRASNAAALGSRDLVIETGKQRLLLSDELLITETAPNVEEAVLQLRWNVDRSVTESGAPLDDVDLRAVFVVPLDPPCGAPPPRTWPPYAAFDEVLLKVDDDTPDEVDCPTPKTLDAGPEVQLRSKDSVITLSRVSQNGGAYTTYEGLDQSAGSYPYDQTFDFLSPGSDQVPALELPGVLRTVPAPVTLLDASVRAHRRSRDLSVNWNPASTYPNADLGLWVWGRVANSDLQATLFAPPWDDGQMDIPASMMTQLHAGAATLALRSSTTGSIFSLPFSEREQPIATSSVSMTQRLLLE